MQQSDKTIFTIGTSTRSPEELFSILISFGVSLIIDIRRFPKSSRYPHFNRKNLEASAPQYGLRYEWLGDLLGGYRKGGYDAYRRTVEYQKGLEKLENLGEKNVSTMMCAELLPWKCHRFLVSRDLASRGWRVIHILEKGRTWEPSTKGKQQGILFEKDYS